MTRTRPLTAAALAASLALAAPALAGQAAATPLAGSVGPGFTIKLSKGGQAVRSLRHGRYTVTVADRSSVHDFDLFGPGVKKVITSVSFQGTKSVTVTLAKGTYTYQCDPHASSGMKGTFKVT